MVISENEDMLEIKCEKLDEARGSFKLGKACGDDLIELDMIKFMGPEGREWLLVFLTRLGQKKRYQQTGIRTYSYRIICMHSEVFKMYTKILE